MSLLYLIFVGAAAHIALIASLFLAINYFQLTPRQFVSKALEKAGIESSWVQDAVRPSARYSSHILDGKIMSAHPRILLPELRQWDGRDLSEVIKQRKKIFGKAVLAEYNPCSGGGVMAEASCWLSTGNDELVKNAVSKLKTFEPQTPNVDGNYGDGWQLAFAYDLLALSPKFGDVDRRLVEEKIAYALRDYLALLDDDSPSLWHGRASLASMAWLCASVLDPSMDKYDELVSRAQGHFLDLVVALELTEAWPEGYNYWINTRALVVTLALGAYLNALEDSKYHERIKNLLERIGLWHLYATRPDNRIEGLGDEGPRVDLKDETRRIIDLIAQFTQNPIFSRYSTYLQELHGRESYYRDYRWSFLLFNDPSVDAVAPGAGFASLQHSLSKAEIFGKDVMGLAYIRSGWEGGETFISYRAGSTFTHHGHYDAGHFTLFKGEPLAVNSSVYGGYFSENRLNYSIRTIAKNSLLILRPGEKVQPNRFFKENVADGGQRVVIPTGSAINSTQHWQENLDDGWKLRGGRIESFVNDESSGFSYILSDLTDAYNTISHDEGGRGGKIKQVKRTLLYLYDQDRLFVYDRIFSLDAGYVKKWLLHSVERPIVDRERLLKGEFENGITETSSDVAIIKNSESSLFVQRIFPENGVIRLVGGEDYQYYVESDGDESILDGKNYATGASRESWFDVANWRLEIQSIAPQKFEEFLVVMTPSIGQTRKDKVQALSVSSDYEGRAVLANNRVLLFVGQQPRGRYSFKWPLGGDKLLVVGIPSYAKVSVDVGDLKFAQRISNDGVVSLNVPVNSAGKDFKLAW